MAAWVLAHPVAHAVAQTPSAAEPPTIEKVIIDQSRALYIEGEGRPGDVVDIVSGEDVLGEATVSKSGQWRIDLNTGLKAGTYHIRADARAGAAGARTTGDEIRVAIPSDLGVRAVVQYDGTAGEPERATRQRAERLAEGAGQAFEDITKRKTATDPVAAPATDGVAAPEADEPSNPTVQDGALAVVIEWLKRSAKTYRDEVVQKLGVANSETAAPDSADDDKPIAVAPPVDAQQAAETISKERDAAEARRIELAEADAVRKAEQAEKAAVEAAQKEALKRKQAEEFARKKAEADKRIAEDMVRLKAAKEEADRAKARKDAELRSKTPQQKATITLERFYLPGEKRPREEKPLASDVRAAAVTDADPSGSRSLTAGRCVQGRVVHRQGRRWYVTGADDTLWDIAERFYGSGLAYPRIYQVNRKRLSSPHVVRPCLALRLPGRR